MSAGFSRRSAPRDIALCLLATLPFCADSLPWVGPLPDSPGLFICAGFSGAPSLYSVIRNYEKAAPIWLAARARTHTRHFIFGWRRARCKIRPWYDTDLSGGQRGRANAARKRPSQSFCGQLFALRSHGKGVILYA